MIEKFLETGPHVARFIEGHTSFGWIPALWPDYRSDIDGASVGRALFPGPYSPEGLGEAARFVRPALTTGMARNPLPLWLLGGIGIDDVWLAGPALVGALLEAGLRNGVDVRVKAPATRLVTDESGVHGVVVRADGDEHTVRAARGVLLASGRFESSDELTTTHLGAPFGVQVSPAGHDGIAVQLAEEVGADLTGMEDAWWMPGVQLPGEELEGRPLSRVFLGERALPHSIMVNSRGERFADEALPYDQFGRIMRQVDPETGTMPNATAWLIFDHDYWTRFGIFGVPPGGDVPDYLHRADTLAELAAEIGVDEVGLLRTVDRFNPEAARARDPQFDRGGTLFDRYFGAFHPRLGENSPDARFPAATAKARIRVGADQADAAPLRADRRQDPHGAGAVSQPLVARHAPARDARADDRADAGRRARRRDRVRPARPPRPDHEQRRAGAARRARPAPGVRGLLRRADRCAARSRSRGRDPRAAVRPGRAGVPGRPRQRQLRPGRGHALLADPRRDRARAGPVRLGGSTARRARSSSSGTASTSRTPATRAGRRRWPPTPTG